MSEVLVDASHVSKKFCRSLKRSLWYGVTDIARSLNPVSPDPDPSIDAASALPSLRRHEFWALRDISFALRRGECLGLIGHNGAGKSTLLKILNGLIRPDTGRIRMTGRVGALIELNAGFNPILSGRENVFYQSSLLGFDAAETRKRFDDIVDFSEIGEFIDMPVQNYSSGMRVRLGFAVAAQMEPDILLIDEVLAVGDVGFRAKCLARMGELRQKSAFIFVSHSMPQVSRISTHILHLQEGKTELLTTDLSHGLDSYYAAFKSSETAQIGGGQVVVREIHASSKGGEAMMGEQLPVGWDDEVKLDIECEFAPGTEAATVQLVIWNQELVPIIDVLGADHRRVPIRPGPDGRCRISSRMKGLQLNSGRFSISVIVLSPDGLVSYCQVDQAVELRVTSNHGSGCSVLWPGSWIAHA